MSITITFRIALVATALCAIPATAVRADNLPPADDETADAPATDGDEDAAEATTPESAAATTIDLDDLFPADSQFATTIHPTPRFTDEGWWFCNTRAFTLVADSPDLINYPGMEPAAQPDASEENDGELIDVERPEE
jgi:hypothetical protein